MSNLLSISPAQIGHRNSKQTFIQSTKNTKKQTVTLRSEQADPDGRHTSTFMRKQLRIQSEIKVYNEAPLKNDRIKANQNHGNRQTNTKMLQSIESEGIFNQMQQNKKKKKKRIHKNKNSNKQIAGSLDHININNLTEDQSSGAQIQKKQELKRKSTKKNHYIIRKKPNQQQKINGQVTNNKQNKQIKAMKQLIDQQNSIQIQQSNQIDNEKLQGWVIKTYTKNFYTSNDEDMRIDQFSPSTSPQSKNQLHHIETNNRHIYFSPNKDQSSKLLNNPRNTLLSRPDSKKKNNHQITTSQFLKQLKLKYAKIAQQKHEKDLQNTHHNRIHSQDHENNYVIVNNHNRNKTQDMMMMEQGMKYKSFVNYQQNCHCNYCLVNINSIKDERNQKFIKYSDNRPNMRVKKPAGEENFENLKKKIQKSRQVREREENKRINHDGLHPKPDSKSKSRLINFNTNMKNGNGDYNGQEQRNLTIDASQLQFSRIHINQYISYGEQKKKRMNFRKQLQLIKSKTSKNSNFSKVNILDKNLDNIQLINSKNDCTFVDQKNKLIKIKLKYLRNLKINPNVNTKTIQPKNIERAKIMPQVGSLKKFNYHSQNNIIKGNISTRNHTQIPWEQRITARGGQQFERLRRLLKKQQDEPVFLIFEKQRASRNASENRNRNQNFHKNNI